MTSIAPKLYSFNVGWDSLNVNCLITTLHDHRKLFLHALYFGVVHYSCIVVKAKEQVQFKLEVPFLGHSRVLATINRCSLLCCLQYRGNMKCIYMFTYSIQVPPEVLLICSVFMFTSDLVSKRFIMCLIT